MSELKQAFACLSQAKGKAEGNPIQLTAVRYLALSPSPAPAPPTSRKPGTERMRHFRGPIRGSSRPLLLVVAQKQARSCTRHASSTTPFLLIHHPSGLCCFSHFALASYSCSQNQDSECRTACSVAILLPKTSDFTSLMFVSTNTLEKDMQITS